MRPLCRRKTCSREIACWFAGRHRRDGHTIAALAVIVMKQADVAAKQQHERDDWQKRGVGGLVTKVDAAAGTITISSGGMGASRSIAIHIAKDTILRRYAPGSVKFDDAKPAPVDQDQSGRSVARARNSQPRWQRDERGGNCLRRISEYCGNHQGRSTQSNNTMTVQDAIRKSAVMVKVSPDSQMKKLPAEMAQRIAMRLKGTARRRRRSTWRQRPRPSPEHGRAGCCAASRWGASRDGIASGARPGRGMGMALRICSAC